MSKAFAFDWLVPFATTIKVFVEKWVTAEAAILYIVLALLAPCAIETTVVAIAYTWLRVAGFCPPPQTYAHIVSFLTLLCCDHLPRLSAWHTAHLIADSVFPIAFA